MVHAGFGTGNGKREKRSRENGKDGDFHFGTLETRTRAFVRYAWASPSSAIRCEMLAELPIVWNAAYSQRSPRQKISSSHSPPLYHSTHGHLFTQLGH